MLEKVKRFKEIENTSKRYRGKVYKECTGKGLKG